MDFKFVNKSNDFYAKKNCERELNDILEVNDEDGTYYRIYLNKSSHYAEVPTNDDMLQELKTMTWTLDNKEKNSKLVKSNSEINHTTYLSDVLEHFGYDRLDYEVYPDKPNISRIPQKLYIEKRKEYKQHIM